MICHKCVEQKRLTLRGGRGMCYIGEATISPNRYVSGMEAVAGLEARMALLDEEVDVTQDQMERARVFAKHCKKAQPLGTFTSHKDGLTYQVENQHQINCMPDITKM